MAMYQTSDCLLDIHMASGTFASYSAKRTAEDSSWRNKWAHISSDFKENFKYASTSSHCTFLSCMAKGLFDVCTADDILFVILCAAQVFDTLIPHVAASTLSPLLERTKNAFVRNVTTATSGSLMRDIIAHDGVSKSCKTIMLVSISTAVKVLQHKGVDPAVIKEFEKLRTIPLVESTDRRSPAPTHEERMQIPNKHRERPCPETVQVQSMDSNTQFPSTFPAVDFEESLLEARNYGLTCHVKYELFQGNWSINNTWSKQ